MNQLGSDVGRRALVTGATGFAGRNLVRRLVETGWAVHALTRGTPNRSGSLPRDVTIHVTPDVDAQAGAVVAAVRPDAVFHLAALSAHHQQGQLHALIRANVTLSAAVAEACAQTGARLVHVTSSAKHYQGAEYSPVSLYGATKQAQCDLIQYYIEAEGLDAREACLFDTYGPGDDRGRLVDLLLDAAWHGTPLGLSQGRQLIDLTHIDDVAIALEMLGLHDEPVGRLVVRSGQPVTVRRLADIVSEVTGRAVDARWGARPERPREMLTDWVVASDHIGWAPRIGLRDGVAQLWAVRKGEST